MKHHTMDEYKEIGMDFKIIHDVICNLSVKVGKHGKIKYGDKLRRLLDKFDHIRSDLEEEMFKDHPTESTTHVFYGERPDIKEFLNSKKRD